MAEYTLTCRSCSVIFHEQDLHRKHYSSEWHCYNQKRKAAGILSHVTEAAFLELQADNKAQEAATKAVNEKKSCLCCVCKKTFSTKNAYASHLKSKNHLDKEAKKHEQEEAQRKSIEEKQAAQGIIETNSEEIAAKNLKNSANVVKKASPAEDDDSSSDDDEDMEVEEVDDDEWQDGARGLEECLFCNHISRSMHRNIKHMAHHHSFFIPCLVHVTDLEGLIQFLGTMVGAIKQCMYCFKEYAKLKDVQQHMNDTGHRRMKMDVNALETYYGDYYDFGEEEESDDEADYDDGDIPTEMAFKKDDGTTKVITSRQLSSVYKHSARPERALVQSTKANKLIAQHRALGWHDTPAAIKQYKKTLKHVHRQEQKQRNRLQCKAHTLFVVRPQVIF